MDSAVLGAGHATVTVTVAVAAVSLPSPLATAQASGARRLLPEGCPAAQMRLAVLAVSLGPLRSMWCTSGVAFGWGWVALLGRLYFSGVVVAFSGHVRVATIGVGRLHVSRFGVGQLSPTVRRTSEGSERFRRLGSLGVPEGSAVPWSSWRSKSSWLQEVPAVFVDLRMKHLYFRALGPTGSVGFG